MSPSIDKKVSGAIAEAKHGLDAIIWVRTAFRVNASPPGTEEYRIKQIFLTMNTLMNRISRDNLYEDKRRYDELRAQVAEDISRISQEDTRLYFEDFLQVAFGKRRYLPE